MLVRLDHVSYEIIGNRRENLRRGVALMDSDRLAIGEQIILLICLNK